MTFKIVLQNNFSAYSVDLEYSFEPLVKRKPDGRERNLTTISNQDPEAARHFAFQPGQENPSLEWTIYDNGEDKSNGSLSSSGISDSRFSNDTVTTVKEQVIWITEYIADNTSNPRWLLFGGRFTDRDGNGNGEGTNVVIENINHRRVAGRKAAEAEINMKLGVTI